MKRKDNFFIIVRKNITRIKYIGLVLMFFSSIITIRTYINYLAIQETIQKSRYEIWKQEEQIAYTKNFLLPYYNSEYRDYFFRHKNRILNPGEKIVQIKIISPEEQKILENSKNEEFSSNNEATMTAVESWNQFIREKIEQI